MALWYTFLVPLVKHWRDPWVDVLLINGPGTAVVLVAVAWIRRVRPPHSSVQLTKYRLIRWDMTDCPRFWVFGGRRSFMSNPSPGRIHSLCLVNYCEALSISLWSSGQRQRGQDQRFLSKSAMPPMARRIASQRSYIEAGLYRAFRTYGSHP